jgi:hypothetical protein
MGMMNDIDPSETEEQQAGWPGDGSGEDDLADYNQNEADDYRDEGADMDAADFEECQEMSEPEGNEDTPMGDAYGGE